MFTAGAKPCVAQSAPVLSRSTLPASGRQEAILAVSKFGRYAVTVTSPQGTALQGIDRLSGPGVLQGVPGKTDGRLDLFLDRGDYKIVAHSHEKGSGEAHLTTHAFTERNAPQPPLLVELKPVDTALNDFEQISYWLDVKERRQVALEAGGRNLADLRLWTNGDWLVDAVPVTEVVTPKSGQPLLVCRLVADLNPGLYLLTAYGGAPQPWAEDSPEHPFHLRYGIPKLGEIGRRRFQVGPFGIDRWLVPGPADYFRLELPEARPAALTVGWYDSQRPFAASGEAQRITKNSMVPVAEVESGGNRNQDHIVTVAAPAGQPYVLQHFQMLRAWNNQTSVAFPRDGRYWFSTVHAGDPTDSVDATAIVTRRPRQSSGKEEAYRDEVVALDAHHAWHRRCNLLEPFTVLLHVAEAGKYEIQAQGAAARFLIEPFFTYRPEHYQAPPDQGPGEAWDLNPGYYVFTAKPKKKGIIDVSVRMANTNGEAPPLNAAVQFQQVDLSDRFVYALYRNQQPGVRAGLVLRSLPLDLTQPLPVSQQPGETVSVPFKVDEPGTLRAETEDGSLLETAVDHGAWQRTQTVKSGEHIIDVRHAEKTTVNYALVVEPQRLQAATALPPLPDPARATPPKLPLVKEKEPQFFDLDRTAAATFLLRADAPALYKLQSTGLLATEGNLRTRIVTSFDRKRANGIGRNFFIQQYLRQGDYQITVSAQGASKGHLGLTLERTQLLDGGELADGGPARLALPAGAAVLYRFTISEPGEYRLRSIGVGTTFTCRIEDNGGWPIVQPNIPADVTRHFEPGTYQIVSLPEPVATRRVTLLARLPEALRLTGHGPHALPLAQRLEHVWMEPEGEGERVPDSWEFVVPAPIDVLLELTNEMQGNLVQQQDDGATTPIASLPPGRGWKGKLETGRYRLDASCVRANNQLTYTIGVWPEQLVAGLDRLVTPPIGIPVSVGQDGLAQLSSFGSIDVRAQLYDNAGRLVASNDDGPGDWNFQIQARLAAGTYRLQVDPVGAPPLPTIAPTPTPISETEPEADSGEQPAAEATSAESSAACVVSMRLPEEAVQPPLVLPAATDSALGATVQLYPLQLAANAELLLVAAHSPENLGCAVEAATAGGVWRTLGSVLGRVVHVEVPLAGGAQYRLRMWSLDGRATTAQVSAAAIAPSHLSERQLQDGAVLAAVPSMDPPIAAVAVHIDHPGIFRITPDSNPDATAPRLSSLPDFPCEEPANDQVTVTGSTLWLVKDLPKTAAKEKIVAGRLRLRSGDEEAVQARLATDQSALCDLEPLKQNGPVLVLATSMNGQPGLRVIERQEAASAGGNGQAMAVGTRAAVAVTLNAHEPLALVWQAGESTDSLAAKLRQFSFTSSPPEQAVWGPWDTALAGIAARAFDLPPGAKRLRLALQAATVAVLSDGDRIASVHWRGNEPFEETLETTATRLTVLHTRDSEDHFRVEMLPLNAGETATALAAGAAYEHAEQRTGIVRVEVAGVANDPDRPSILHVRGNNAEPVLIGVDGRIVRATDFPVPLGGGTLLIPHGPALVLAWIDRRGEEAQDLWGGAALPAGTSVQPPAVVTLSSTVQALQLAPTQPLMLHLRSSTPMITLLTRGALPPDVQVHASGALLDVYLDQPAQLGLRAISAGTLSGSAELTATPVSPIREGLGPEILLSPGTTRLFSFTVTRPGLVGIGVRSNPDVVQCTLLDRAGKPLGTGVVQMPTLKPGTYLLSLHAPVDAGPATARPALAGIELPSTGPPQDVVRSFMAMAGAVAAPSSKHTDGIDDSE